VSGVGVVSDPLFYALAVPVVLVVGISKGGFGGGVGMIAVPVLSFAVPLPQAAAILLPILCVMDLVAVAGFRGQYSSLNLWRLLPPALLGIALGSLVFGTFDERWLRVAVGAIAVAFSADWVLGLSRRRGAPVRPRAPGRWGGALWGTVAGFTSTLAHAGGPPVSVYLLPQRMSPTLYVGTTVVVFTVINYVKLIPYAWLGQLRADNLATSLLLLPLAPIGVRLGRWLHDRIDETLFYRIAYGLLLLSGLKLLSEALPG
jgi:uncharacterized membrane protein YfcA